MIIIIHENKKEAVSKG